MKIVHCTVLYSDRHEKRQYERQIIYLKKNSALAGINSCGSSILVEREFRLLVFVEGGKWRTWRKLLEREENQQNTQPTNDTGREWNPGHIGERRALPLLRNSCSLN